MKIVYRATFDADRPYEREFEGLKKFEPVSRTHESQVSLLHVGRNDNQGYFYHIMELADDQSMGQEIDPEGYQPRTLRSELKNQDLLPFQQCVSIGLALTEALEQRKYSEAESQLIAAYKGLIGCEANSPAAVRPRLNETMARLARLCQETQRPAEAAAWKEKLTALEAVNSKTAAHPTGTNSLAPTPPQRKS